MKLCSTRLVDEGFTFKLDESNQLLYRILTNQVKLDDTVGSVLMLCKNNASMDLAYENGDSLVFVEIYKLILKFCRLV